MCCTQGITCDANARVTGITIEASCPTCGGGQKLIAKPLNFGGPLGNLKSILKQLSLINVQVQFKIPIPPVFFTLGKLDFLQLEGCGFIGSLPNELGNLRLLQELKISGNRLSGGVPNTISNLKELRILQLGSNQLTTLGSWKLTLLQKLDRVDFSRNKITGSIPKWLGGLTLAGPFFNELLLSFNQFSGTIPAELCNIRGMRYLALRGNKLSGRIPAGIGKCTSLMYLILGQNSLSGPLPRELGKLKNLVELTADKNKLSGPLPRELGDLPELTFVKLQNNKITGGIPSNYGPFDPLVSDPIDLTNNMLKGKPIFSASSTSRSDSAAHSISCWNLNGN